MTLPRAHPSALHKRPLEACICILSNYHIIYSQDNFSPPAGRTGTTRERVEMTL